MMDSIFDKYDNLKHNTMYQPIESVTFDSMPNAVSKLMKEVNEMKEMLQTIANNQIFNI